MRRLHVVGISGDRRSLVLATRRGAKTGTFQVPLDDDLLDLLDSARSGAAETDDLAVTPPPAPRPAREESVLSPREIQARLRSGRTIAEVAHEAGVSTSWIDRFAAPVIAEQQAAVAGAVQATMTSPRRGESDRHLEASVARNLADRNVTMTPGEMADCWQARYLADGEWLISFQYRSRGRFLIAEWSFRPAEKALDPRNRLGGDLGFVEPSQPGVARAQAAKKASPNPRGGAGTRATNSAAGTRSRAGTDRAAPAGKAAPRSVSEKAAASESYPVTQVIRPYVPPEPAPAEADRGAAPAARSRRSGRPDRPLRAVRQPGSAKPSGRGA